MEVIYILNIGNFDKKIYNWVHKDPDNVNQIGFRALVVAISPLILGGVIALVMLSIIEMVGLL